MSYTSIKNITNDIISKNILFLDLETIGLIKKKNNDIYVNQENKYPDYKKNELYDSSRIVQIGWIYLEDFDYTYEIQPENILSKLVKPDGFEIPEESIKIHKITNEIANEKGLSIKKVLKKIVKIFEEVEYIIGYNIYYDINILLNEMNRLKMKSSIKQIKNLIKNQKILCIGELAKQYKNYRGNMPKQTTIYRVLFEKDLENAHNAQYDIYGTIKLMFWFNENKEKFINKTENNTIKNI